jgi:predicted alpha/beta hydrolase
VSKPTSRSAGRAPSVPSVPRGPFVPSDASLASATAAPRSAALAAPRLPAAKVLADTFAVTTRDGAQLAATLYTPRDGAVERAVVIGCATAVRRGFYEPYARYLAAQGCAALTFDYRGIGGSLHGPLHTSTATIRDWGERDYPAVIAELHARYPRLPMHLVGHSVGGQLIGLIENADRLSSACTVAAQHGYWRLYPARQALTYALLWYGLMPTLTRALSYFPSRRLKLGEDLPAGVARQWARWARSRHYMIDERGEPLRAGFASFRKPILAYSFSDDVRAPERCVRELHRWFAAAEVEHRHVSPQALSAPAIGHVGFFRATFKSSLWHDSLQWLRGH